MPSVTDLVKAISGASEGLVQWANRVGLEGKTLDDARAPKRDAGNRLHAELERLVNGEPLDDPADDAVIALAEWWSGAGAGFDQAWAEKPVRAAAFGIEVWGRIDVLCATGPDRVAAAMVWDAKVGKKPYVGLDNVLQVGIYQAIYALGNRTRAGNLPLVGGGVVRLSEDGALRVVASPWDGEAAVDLLGTAAAMWRCQIEAKNAAAGYVSA